jgi:hypothetical protein
MRTLLFLLLSVSTIYLNGQNGQPGKNHGENIFATLNDSLPQVIYKNTQGTQRAPAYFVNGLEVGETALKSLDPEQIASIDVRKKQETTDNIPDYGRVSITMKEGYQPRLISLNALKSKYTTIKDGPVLFMMENDIVRGDYNKNLVDECSLLQIIVDKVEVKSANLDFYLIRLLTRTPENIKKSKEIRIR